MPYTAITHDSRHPFETYTLGAFVIAGGAAIFGDLWPSAIVQYFPAWAQTLWGVLFGGGAFMALYGVSIENRETGIFLEQVGLIMAGGMCWTYAATIFFINFDGGFAVAIILTMIGAACFRQWFRLEKFIRTAISRSRRLRRSNG